MAQLRQDYHQYTRRDTEIVVVGPDEARYFKDYWKKHRLPFVGLPDPGFRVLKLYGQEVNLFRLGRMPAQVIIDKNGIARYVHYGKAMSDIPKNSDLLHLLDELNSNADQESLASKK